MIVKRIFNEYNEGVLDETRISEGENKLKLKLPISYIRFLKKQNDRYINGDLELNIYISLVSTVYLFKYFNYRI